MFSVDDPYTKTAIKRFRRKVNKVEEDKCWIFTGTTAVKGGYGQFYFRDKQVYSNRFALMIKLNRELKPKKFALHTCDNPPCCNPKHLYEGSHRRNMSDAVSRKRMRGSINSGNFQVGSRHRNALFLDKDIVYIRCLYKQGKTRTEISKEMKTSFMVIDRIVKGKTYADVVVT